MSVVVQTQSAQTAAADDPHLSYTVTTTPSPLKASPENSQVPEETGELVISVARQGGIPADVEWIKVKVPAGTMAPDLATDLAKISPRISLTGWTVRLDAAAKEFVFEPAASHAPIGPDSGFTLQLSDIPMSRKVGTAPVTVTERSRTGSNAFENRATVFNLGKFPADFYLRNFLCEPSIIPNGGDVHLTWERSANATYELLYGDVNRDVTNRTSLDIEGIKSDTTFYLRATTGDPTNPVVRILSAQVTVTKPDLDIGNLTVNGTIIAKGNVSIAPGKQLAVPKIVGNGGGIEVGNTITQSYGGITVNTGGLTARTVTARETLRAGFPTASASKESSQWYPLELMLDGKESTFYESRERVQRAGDWVMVDLAEIRTITKVEIRFALTIGGARLETSTDRSNWTARGNIGSGAAYSNTLPDGTSARYVRVMVTQDLGLPIRIREFLVTPSASFIVGPEPGLGGALSTEEPPASTDSAAATNDGGQRPSADTQPSPADPALPTQDTDTPDGTRGQ
ncbi:discoidin domain-containing protein [Streptomyces flavidovirens]